MIRGTEKAVDTKRVLDELLAQAYSQEMLSLVAVGLRLSAQSY